MPLEAPEAHRAVTVRAVLLGLLGTIVICGLTPYNDYALNNTFLIGNNLPLGVVMVLFLFIVFVNAPLSRFFPKRAFTAGELTVAFSMTLISCALPSSGLMRYFPASLVSPLYHAQGQQEFLSLLASMHLPKWLFPTFSGSSPREWINDPIVTDYIGRWTQAGPIPYRAWVTPALTWGVFLFALFGALICMVTLLRRQWYENERLAFPLAQIYLSLLETPDRGRAFNSILSRRSFWISFSCVFLLHAWNGLSHYFPRLFVVIPVYYSQWALFSEKPWDFLDTKIKDAAVFFTVTGVTYFLSTSVSFSLWFFYILHQFYRMYLGTYAGDPEVHGQHDQHFGGIVAYAVAVLWIGRNHWKLLARQAIRGAREGEPRGRYLPYPFAVWTLIACTITMIGWLMAAGANLLTSVFSVLLLLMLFMIITRIIAESGLVHGQLQAPIYRPWQLLVRAGVNHPIPESSFYLTSLLQAVHYDFREVVPVYASHGIKASDQTIFGGHDLEGDSRGHRRTGRRFIGAMAVALFVGYFVSFFSTLWTEYHFAWTRDTQGKMPINDWGAYWNPLWSIVYANVQYHRQSYLQPYSSAAHFTFGFGFTALLSFLRLRFTWWPLHPIGYLMLGTFPGAHLWFSIFWGWLAKVVILRFSGAKGYVNAKPFFLGLIVGESAAAGFWLITGIVLSMLNLPYRPINIMPG